MKLVGEVAQPRMLVLARESRSLTQGELAAAIQDLEPGGKISQGYVSRAEAGRLAVAGDRLELFARALRYPVSLLCRSELEVGAGPGLVHHRKKQSASAGDLRRIHAVLNLSHIQLRALAAGAPRPDHGGIPHIPVDDYNTPEEAAQKLRGDWAVPDGPLASVVELVEQAGGLVACRALVDPVPLDSGAEVVPVDAVSTCPPGEDPVVLLNVGTPAERQRFTLAHELAHVVLHPVPHPEQEKQANRFAAELLMPAREIRRQLQQGAIDVPRLLELKARWRVSMWALLRRAHTLGVISDWQYRSVAVELSSLGYRTREPDELDTETPTAITAIVDWHVQHGRTVADLAETAGLQTDEFTSLYLDPPDPADSGGAGRPVSSTGAETIR